MARGSVFKKGKKWAVRYDAGPHPVTSKRTQGFKGGFDTEQEAEAALAVALADVVKHTHVHTSRTTFEGFAEDWLTNATGRPITLNRYKTALHHHLIPALGKHRIQEVRPRHVEKFYRDCADQGLRGSTINELHVRLGQIFKAAVREQLLPRSIMDEVQAPKTERQDFNVWTVAQLMQFLEQSLSGPYDRLWHLYAMSGVRRGEALGLRWKDVDFTQKMIRIRQQAVREGGSIALRALKTRRSHRDVLLDAGTLVQLRAQRQWVNEQRMAYRTTWQERDLVFPYVSRRSDAPTPPGLPIDPDNVSMLWATRVAKTTLPRLRLHDLRHSHATHLLQAGTPVHVVAQRLGHTPGMLLAVYAHVVKEQDQAVVNWLEMAFK